MGEDLLAIISCKVIYAITGERMNQYSRQCEGVRSVGFNCGNEKNGRVRG